MGYAIFLDDERFPPDNGMNWIIARNCDDFFKIIDERGWPDFVSFDHDLGEGPTGHDVAKRITERLLMSHAMLPPCLPFEYYVHSANPIGRANIEGTLEAWKRMFGPKIV